METTGFRLLYPPGTTAEGSAMRDFDFVRTLQVDQMVAIKRESYRGIPDLQLERFFSCDPAVLGYRADVIDEFAASAPLCALLEQALPLLRDVYDMRRQLTRVDGTLESGLAATRYIELYIEVVELFRARLAEVEPRSAGVCRLKQEVTARCESADYKALTEQLGKVEQQISHVKSITLGINLDSTLQVREAGLLALNDRPYRAGSIMDRLTGRASSDPMVCMSAFAPVARTSREEDKAALNAAVHRALDAVFVRTIRSWEPVIHQYFHDETRFFVELLDDLRFLSAAVAFLRELRAAHCPTCRPQIRPMADRVLELHGLRNPMLALHDPSAQVIANDLCYDEKGRFYLVTGPNHGGKSIFCYAVGMAQALFQLGLPVPAESAVMSPVSGIYTHFPTSDEGNYGKGRLESECARIAAILHKLTATDMLLMDESFSSTSLLEGGCIAGEVLRAIAVIGCGGIFVTHIHELTRQVDQFNAMPGRRGCIDNLCAQMENVADGTRSFRVTRAAPDGLSYARDIAAKYGLSCESILAQSQAKGASSATSL